MASRSVLTFDHEGRPIQFDTWLDDLQLDSATRSQWLTRDAAARLAVRNHLPLAERAHFGQHKTAKALYDAVVARYSSPATAALSRLILPYLFPELSSFAKVGDLITHLRTSDARYRAALPAEDQFLALDPTYLTVDLLKKHLLAAETSAVAVGATRGTPRTPFLGVFPLPPCPLLHFCYSARARVARVVAVAAGVVVVGAVEAVEVAEVVAVVGVVAGVWLAVVAAVGVVEAAVVAVGRGASGGSVRCPYVIRTEFGDEAECSCWLELLRSGVDIFSLDYDPILAAMSRESALPGTAPAEALHTFTLDSGASRCFFRESTTLTPLTAPVPIRLAYPSGGPLLACSSTVLPCPAVPSGSLSGLHLLSFSMNLVSASPLALACPAPPSLRRGAVAHRSSLLLVSPDDCSLAESPHGHEGLARVSRQGRERYFLLVVDDYTCYTTVFPLRSKSEVPDVLIPWLRAVHLQLRDRIHKDLPVLRLHSDKGGEFSSDLSRDFCHGEGILQWFTLPASPQKNGIAERHIGLVMEVARTSMIHAVAPHFLWPFAVRYAAHQLNLKPRVSLPETSPTLPFPLTRLAGSFTTPPRDVSFPLRMSRLTRRFPFTISSSAALPLSSPPSLFLAPGPPPVDPLPPQGPAPSGVSQVDPLSGAVPVKVAVDSGATRGAASGGAAFGGATSVGDEPEGAEPGGAESERVDSGGAKPRGAERGGNEPGGEEHEGAESKGVESGGAEPRGNASPRREPLSPQQLREWVPQRTRLRSGVAGAGGYAARGIGAGGAGATSLGVAGVSAGAGGTEGAGAAGPGGARTRGTGAAGAGGVGGAGARDPRAGVTGAGAGDPGIGGARAGGTGAGGAGAVGAGAGNPGAGGAGARGAGAGGTGAEGTVQRRPFFVPPPPLSLPPPDSVLCQVLNLPSSTGLTPSLMCPSPDQSQPQLLPDSPLPPPSPYVEQTDSFTEPQEPESHPASPVRAVCSGRRVPRSRPPPVPGTYVMALRPSSVPLRVPLPSPLVSSLPDIPEPESDLVRAASPTIPRLLATVFTDPSFEATAASALVAELVDFATAYRLDYATSLVPESETVFPPSVAGECALGTNVLVDTQEDFECLATAVPHLVAMLLAPEGDPDAPDIPTPRSNAEAITGPQWSLQRLVYGLRQAPREWHDTLRTSLAARGFAPSSADPSLFLRTDTSLPLFYILVYVDDLVFATADTEELALVKLKLQKRHTCIDLGELRSYLGLHITQDRARRTITLNQSHMVHQVLKRFGFWYSSPQSTSLPTGQLLSAPPLDESVEPSGPSPELVGCLIALALSGPARTVSRCPATTRTACPPARHALLQPARRTLLLRASRPSAACTSRPAAASASRSAAQRVAPYCSQRVVPYCSQRVAPCCPASRALLQPARCALLQPARRALLPCASRPAAASASLPAAASGSRPAAASASRPTAASASRSAALRPAATTAAAAAARAIVAAGGGAAGSAGSAAGAGGAGGATRSAGGAAGAGGATRSAGGAAGARGAGPTTDRHCLSWPLSRQLQRLRMDGGGHCLSRMTPPLSSFASGFFSELVQVVEALVFYAAALGASESAATLGASESAAALGAHASPATGPSSTEALHTFTLDSGASRCFFRDCTTLTPLAAPVPVSLADPTGGLLVARASTVLPCLAVLRFSGSVWRSVRAPGLAVTWLPSCSCRVLSHETLLWHHRLGHPSLPRLRNMHSRLLVSGLPRSLPSLPRSPAPPCLPCVEGRQRTAPHSSEFPQATAPLQTLHMDVWGPAPVGGTDQECYFLLVVDDYTRYTTVFPLRCKADVSGVLIPWIRATHRQLCERFCQDFPVLRLRSDRGGEFSSDLLVEFCRDEGIVQSFTLPTSPQQNGIAERRIGLIVEVARTSMIHVAAPHFQWPFAVQYVAHQLNLWLRVSEPETSPHSGGRGRLAMCRCFGYGARSPLFAMPKRASSPLALSAASSLDSPPTPRYPLPPQGPAPSGVSQVDPPPLVEPLEISSNSSGPAEGGDPSADDTAATRRSPRLETPPGFPPRPSSPPLQPAIVDSRAETAGAKIGGAEIEGEGSGGAATGGAMTGGATTGGAATRGAGSWGTATGGADSGGPASPSGSGAVGDPAGSPGAGQPPQPDLLETLSPQAICAWIIQRGSPGGGGYGPAGAGVASPGGAAGAGGTRGAAGAGGARATSPRGATCAGGAGPTSPGGTASAEGAGGAADAGGTGAGGSGGAGTGGAGAAGAGGARTRGAGAAGAGGAGGATGATSTRGARGTTGARGPGAVGASGAAGAGGAGVAAGATGAGGAGAAGARGARAASTALRRPFFYPQPQSSLPPPDSVLCQVLSLLSSTGLPLPLLCPPTNQSQPQLLLGSPVSVPTPHTEVIESLTERCEPETCASTPVRARRVTRPRPPTVPGTHGMALRPSSVPQRVVLPEPPASSLPHVPDPESDLARAASPTDTRLLATVVSDPGLESTATFSLVTELVDFAARSHLDYVTSLCLAAALPRFASMLLCPEGDPDALDIPTLRSYTEAQGSLHKEMWLRRPPGFTESFPTGTQWSLRRPVYGLRQALREWHDTLRTTFAALGFAPSSADPSLFLRTDTTLPPFYVLVYVDNLVFATADTKVLALVNAELQERHTCTYLEQVPS
ncbi:unnamed protein product [Closterium sp. NIES-53]